VFVDCGEDVGGGESVRAWGWGDCYHIFGSDVVVG